MVTLCHYPTARVAPLKQDGVYCEPVVRPLPTLFLQRGRGNTLMGTWGDGEEKGGEVISSAGSYTHYQKEEGEIW